MQGVELPAPELGRQIGTPAPAPAPATGARADVAKWLLVALITFVALSMQLRVFPNHDVAWVLWGAHEMLGGARWGHDIIEPNPPLAWYLAMPSGWLADRLGAPIAVVFQLMVVGAALCSITAFDMLSRGDTRPGEAPSWLPTLVAASFLLILPYRDFGQREHLMLMGALPYAALTALRCRGGAVPRTAALAVGVAAGLGFALKPYFLAVPLLVEAATLMVLRRWTSILRPETLAIAAVVGCYGLFVLLFVPDYLAVVVPLAQAIYWSFDVPPASLLIPAILPVIAIAMIWAMLWRSPQRLPVTLSAATAGFLLSYLLQQKAYSYHLLPVTAGAAIAVAAVLSGSGLSPKLRIAAASVLALLLFQPVFQTVHWWRLNGPGGPLAVVQGRLIDAVDRYAANGRFLVVAVHPFPAFPTALYAKGKQVSRTNSQWFLPAVVQLRDGARAPFPGALERAERNARDFILHDLSHAPNLVIIDTDSARHTISRGNFDFLSFYQEDARFRAAWKPYREVQPLDGYRLFVRDGKQGL